MRLRYDSELDPAVRDVIREFDDRLRAALDPSSTSDDWFVGITCNIPERRRWTSRAWTSPDPAATAALAVFDVRLRTGSSYTGAVWMEGERCRGDVSRMDVILPDGRYVGEQLGQWDGDVVAVVRSVLDAMDVSGPAGQVVAVFCYGDLDEYRTLPSEEYARGWRDGVRYHDKSGYSVFLLPQDLEMLADEFPAMYAQVGTNHISERTVS